MAKNSVDVTKINLKSTIAEIESLKKAISQCAEGTDQYKKNMQALSEAEKKWEQEFKKASDTIKNSNSTYKDTATAMSDLKKAWKETSDEATRNNIGKAIGEANQKLKDLDASIGNYQRNVGQYENATKSLKTQLKELKVEMAQMEASGLGASDAYRQLEAQAGKISDAMKKVSSDIANASNDIKGVSNAITIFGDGVAVFGAYKGAMALLGKESEDFEKVMKKLVATQTLLNSVNQIAKALGDNSSVTYKLLRGILEGLGIVKEKEVATSIANTTAKGAETAALEAQNGAIAQNTKELIANDAARQGNIPSSKGLDKIMNTLKSTFTSGTGSVLGYVAALGALVAATIAAAVGLKKLIEYFKREHNPALKDAYEAEQRLNDIRERASGKIVDNMTKLSTYTTTLKTAESGTTAYKNAEQGLIDMADSFDAAIIKKKNGVIDLAATYDNLANAIWNAAVQEATFEKNKEIMKDIIDLKTERKEKKDQYDKESKSGSSHITGGAIAGTGSQFGAIGNTGTMTTVKDADVTRQQIKELDSDIAKKEKELKQNIATAQDLYENVIPKAETKTTKTGGGTPTKTTTSIDNLIEYNKKQEELNEKLSRQLEITRHSYAMLSDEEKNFYDNKINHIEKEYNLTKSTYDTSIDLINKQLENEKLTDAEREKLIKARNDFEMKSAIATNKYLEDLQQENYKREKDNNKNLIAVYQDQANERKKVLTKSTEEINATRDKEVKKWQDKEGETDFWGNTKDYTEEIKKAQLQALEDAYNAKQDYVDREIAENERLMQSMNPLSDEYQKLAESVRKLKEERASNEEQYQKDQEKISNTEPKQLKKRKANYQDYAKATTSLINLVSDAEKASLEQKVKNGEISEEEAEKEFERIKKLEIASAIITTISGAIGAYMADTKTYKPAALGIAIGIADAATTLAAGYAQIDQIKSTTYGGGGGSRGTMSYIPTTSPLLSPEIDQQSLQMVSADRLGNIENNQQNTRVYVVQKDLEDSHNQSKTRIAQTTF